MHHFLNALDSIVRAIIAAGKWLVIPVLTLLFAQWPLRDWLQAYSREANDLGQIFFALYVSIAVTAATRAGMHLAADALARGYSLRARLLIARLGALFGLLPWAIFVVFAGWKIVLSSLTQLEFFSDSYNPGYFIVKSAMGLLALLVIAQAILEVARPKVRDD